MSEWEKAILIGICVWGILVCLFALYRIIQNERKGGWRL